MSPYAWLVIYCLAILLVAVLGGYVPLVGRVTHSKLQLYLSLSAGIMLGAAFFHVMPDAIDKFRDIQCEDYAYWWMVGAVVSLFCIERFIAPHSHEMDGGHGHHHHSADAGEHLSHKHEEALGHSHSDHAHEHHHEHAHEPRPVAPSVAGWMAVLGLTIHTFMNGAGLAGEVQDDIDKGLVGMPGLAIFLAIIFHKPADALAISTVLSRKGVKRGKIVAVLLGFAATVSVGAAAYFLARHSMSQGFQNHLTGAALAFSAGTFLFIALSDLLPEVQFHKHDRVPLFLSLVVGVLFMGFIAYLEPHKEEPKQDADKAGQVEKGGDAHHHDH